MRGHRRLSRLGRQGDPLPGCPLIVDVDASLGGEPLTELKVAVGSVVKVGRGGGCIGCALCIDATASL